MEICPKIKKQEKTFAAPLGPCYEVQESMLSKNLGDRARKLKLHVGVILGNSDTACVMRNKDGKNTEDEKRTSDFYTVKLVLP